MGRLYATLAVAAIVALGTARADERLKGIACRSVHLGYPAPPAVAFYNELTVEASAPGTYFMACGWGKGYFGIQELGDGKKLVLFSVWDPAGGDDPAKVAPEKRVKMLHKDDAVRVRRFGNEGTGGQSFFDYTWKPGTAYRFLVTARPDGEGRTAYAGHFYVPEAKAWKHLVTFSTLTKKDELLRGCYSFVEDFKRNKVSTTKARKAAFGNGWVKSAEGAWKSLDRATFTADANPVTNIDAGADGPRFYLATGGATENTGTKLRATITRAAGAKEPPDDLPRVKEVDARSAPLVVGPFLLGRLYDVMPDQTFSQKAGFRHVSDRLKNLAGPSHHEVVAALNRTKVYVIARTTTDPDTHGRMFTEDAVVTAVEGGLSYDFSDRKGGLFRLHLKKVSLTKQSIFVNAEPQILTTGIRVEMRFGRVAGKFEEIVEELDFYTGRLSIDVEGKAQWD